MRKRRKVAAVPPGLEELERRLVLSTVSPSLSTNWSGYVVAANAGTVSSVTGSWKVPSVTGTGNAYSSTWVGIDGWGSPTVEQIGTEQDVANGVPQYSAWYEMYPSYSVTLSLRIAPGDSITATVSYTSPGRNAAVSIFALSLTDNTTGKAFSTSQSIIGAQRSSVEWVEEAPSSGQGVLPLANFSPVTFTGASATVGGAKGAIDGLAGSNGVNQVNMVSSGSATLDTTSSLTDAATSSGFTVTRSVTSSQPTPPPQQHHHHDWWWWFGPNQAVALAGTSGMLLAASPARGALATGLPATPLQPTAASFLPAVTPPAPFVQAGVALGGGARDPGAPDDPGGDPSAVPPPGANEPGAPGKQLPPESKPDAAPLPMSDPGQAGASLPAAAAAWHRLCDACFMEGRAQSLAQDQGRRAGFGDTGEAGAAAGVLLTLGWGCYWGMAARETPRRRLWLSPQQ